MYFVMQAPFKFKPVLSLRNPCTHHCRNEDIYCICQDRDLEVGPLCYVKYPTAQLGAGQPVPIRHIGQYVIG